jgi:hypothetical protein
VNIAERMLPAVLRFPLTERILTAALASAFVEGFFVGIEYERDRQQEDESLGNDG